MRGTVWCDIHLTYLFKLDRQTTIGSQLDYLSHRLAPVSAIPGDWHWTTSTWDKKKTTTKNTTPFFYIRGDFVGQPHSTATALEFLCKLVTKPSRYTHFLNCISISITTIAISGSCLAIHLIFVLHVSVTFVGFCCLNGLWPWGFLLTPVYKLC